MSGSLAAAVIPAQMPEGQPYPCLFSHALIVGYPVTLPSTPAPQVGDRPQCAFSMATARGNRMLFSR